MSKWDCKLQVSRSQMKKLRSIKSINKIIQQVISIKMTKLRTNNILSRIIKLKIVVKHNPRTFIKCILFKLFNHFSTWKLFNNLLSVKFCKGQWYCPRPITKKYWFLIWMRLWFIVLMILQISHTTCQYRLISKLGMLLRQELILDHMPTNVLSRPRKIIRLLSLLLAIKLMLMLSLILWSKSLSNLITWLMKKNF